MSRPQQLDLQVRIARLLLKPPHRPDSPLAQIGRIGLPGGVAQPGKQLQQRCRGGDQRVHPHRHALDRPLQRHRPLGFGSGRVRLP